MWADNTAQNQALYDESPAGNLFLDEREMLAEMIFLAIEDVMTVTPEIIHKAEACRGLTKRSLPPWGLGVLKAVANAGQAAGWMYEGSSFRRPDKITFEDCCLHLDLSPEAIREALTGQMAEQGIRI